jgi:adenylate cyclase
MKLSPTYPAWYLWLVGKSYREIGQYELAIPAYHEAIEREPESTQARIWLTDSLVEIDRIEDAKTVAQGLLKLQPTFSVEGLMREATYDAAKRDRIMKNLRKAGLPE